MIGKRFKYYKPSKACDKHRVRSSENPECVWYITSSCVLSHT